MKKNFLDFKNFCIKNKINKIYESAISSLNFGGFFVNVKLSNSDEIHNLNKTYRNVDRATDVLSFPNLEFENKDISAETLAGEMDMDTGLVHLGDIIICKEIAKKQASEYGHSYKREICFLALHGLLHLIGYDHETKEEEAEMMNKTEEILKKYKIMR